MRNGLAGTRKGDEVCVIADLQSDLAKTTKDPKFAADFFSKYIYGIEKNDYTALLSKAGLILQKAAPGKSMGWPVNLHPHNRGRSGDAKTAR